MTGGDTRSTRSALTRVLVVGDDRVAERIGTHGFDPFSVDSVAEALDRLAQADPDCVISGVGTDGLELLRAARDSFPERSVPIVVATDDATAVNELLEAGAADVIRASDLAAESGLLAKRVRNAVAGHRTGDGDSRSQLQDGTAVAAAHPTDGTGNALFESVGSPVAYVEYVGTRPKILDVNPAFAETFGVDRPSVVGKNIDDIVASPERHGAATELSERFRTDGATAVEVVRDTAAGPKPFLLRLAPVAGGDRVYATYVDISERKLRERELEELNERISSLHDAANRLLTAESEAAVYEETVRAAIDILEFDWCVTSRPKDGRFELTAASADSPFEVGDAPLAVGEGTSGQAFESGESDLTNDMLANSEGEPVDDAIRSGLTVPIGKFGIFQAVSSETGAFDENDRELAELLVAHTQEALYWFERTDELERQNERLEQFASVVSHDLRNPLTVAQGRIRLALEDGDLSHLETADRALDRMTTIIDDVLALARETLDTETAAVELGTVAETAWSMVDTEGASLVVDVSGAHLADADRLQRLFENLFRNSVEHGDAETVRLEALDDGFVVVDDGSGFADTEHAFESGNSTNGGTGLGLAIVERIADAHGWTVSAVNDANGARVEIRGVERAS